RCRFASRKRLRWRGKKGQKCFSYWFPVRKSLEKLSLEKTGCKGFCEKFHKLRGQTKHGLFLVSDMVIRNSTAQDKTSSGFEAKCPEGRARRPGERRIPPTDLTADYADGADRNKNPCNP